MVGLSIAELMGCMCMFGDCVGFSVSCHSCFVVSSRFPCRIISPFCIMYTACELNQAVHPASQSWPRDNRAPDASLSKRWTVLYLVGMVGRWFRMAVYFAVSVFPSGNMIRIPLSVGCVL